MLLGLAVSTLVTKSDQTMPILVGITMVQVALSGGMFPLTGAVTYVSMIAPARWGMGALASTVNLNVINPQNPLQPTTARRAVGAQAASTGSSTSCVLLVIGMIWMVIAAPPARHDRPAQAQARLGARRGDPALRDLVRRGHATAPGQSGQARGACDPRRGPRSREDAGHRRSCSSS